MELNLKLSIDEINMLLQVLGQTPTSSGVFPLLMKIKSQSETQLEEVRKAANPS